MSGRHLFEIRRGVLQFHRPPDSGELVFLCWPVLVYRVTAPVLRVRHLNIVEKVVLALCRAGVRQPEDIAAKIHQSTELCEHVLRQLRADGRVDQVGAPTDRGVEALVTGRVGEEPEYVVTHVLQDPLTGRLWPRAARDLVFQRVSGVGDGQARLRLDSAGAPRPIAARIVGDGTDLALPRPPSAQEIINAVGAQRKAELARKAEQFTDLRDGRTPSASAVEKDLQAVSTELVLPHGVEVRRVLDTGRPAAEYLLLWLENGSEPGDGPQVRDPFGLDPNPMLRRLLADWNREDPGLADAVAQATDRSFARITEDYRTVREAVGRAAETRLVQRLGNELRRRPGTLKLLLGLEEAAARGGESGVETVAREAFRLYEHLLRRLVAEYPPPERPSWDAGNQTSAWETVKAALKRAAKTLGLDEPHRGGYLGAMTLSRTAILGYPAAYRQTRDIRAVINLDKGFVRDLLPYALIAAADPNSPHRRDHPLRALAGTRPGLLIELDELGRLRNRGSHNTRDATVEDDVEWCRLLALDAARVLVSMPPPPPERT
ncbi:hypothetical protein [Actinomadura spongiicola]|uniref:hypothetical protein n=1 Tax=Actinomadura spongiicola TaxID=2303421 RepID=UPI0011C10465|nr:hypothetical protein [Actinomadura spongiicola]